MNMGYKPNITILCVICFVAGFVISRYGMFYTGQESESITITVNRFYKKCGQEFDVNEYTKGFKNKLNLKEFFNNIQEQCEE